MISVVMPHTNIHHQNAVVQRNLVQIVVEARIDVIVIHQLIHILLATVLKLKAVLVQMIQVHATPVVAVPAALVRPMGVKAIIVRHATMFAVKGIAIIAVIGRQYKRPMGVNNIFQIVPQNVK